MKNIASRENTSSSVRRVLYNHVVPPEISKFRANAQISQPVEETQPHH